MNVKAIKNKKQPSMMIGSTWRVYGFPLLLLLWGHFCIIRFIQKRKIDQIIFENHHKSKKVI